MPGSRRVHEPFGQIDPSVNPSSVGYTGHFFDSELGMVYMQQRYYDPIAGRFLSVDPVTTNAKDGSFFGRYHYANNNPYKFVDPDGRSFQRPEDLRWPNPWGNPLEFPGERMPGFGQISGPEGKEDEIRYGRARDRNWSERDTENFLRLLEGVKLGAIWTGPGRAVVTVTDIGNAGYQYFRGDRGAQVVATGSGLAIEQVVNQVAATPKTLTFAARVAAYAGWMTGYVVSGSQQISRQSPSPHATCSKEQKC